MTAPLGFTSATIQRLRRLHGRRSSRSEEGAFVVEGPVLVAEAVAAGWDVEGQFLAPGVVASVDGAGPVHELAPGVAERISATETPTGLFAVVRTREPRAGLLADAAFVVVADGIADPGNLGTIMRSAEACGVDALVVTPGTVDALNPKVVRASAGALFHVPVVTASLDDVRAERVCASPGRRRTAVSPTRRSTGQGAWPSCSAARRTASPTTLRSTSGCASATADGPNR